MRHIQRITVLIFVLAVVLYIATGIRLKMGEDKTNPVITSDRDIHQVSVNAKESDFLAGLSASDPEEGDLTENIIVGSISKFIKPGMVNVSYVVFDKNNNVGQFVRKTEFTDYQSPEFALTDSLDYPVGSIVKVLDVLTAKDSIDGDITDKIRIIAGEVDAKEAGTYKVRAQVSNDYGDTIEQDLFVNINEKTAVSPVIELKSYMIYIEKGSSFKPQNYIESVVDYQNNDIDESLVEITNNVDKNKPGTYQVTYRVEDENEHEGIRHMIVVVKE